LHGVYARFEAFVALFFSSGFVVGDAHLIGVSGWDPLAAVRAINWLFMVPGTPSPARFSSGICLC
jgi:hypothetical protein